MRKRLCVLVAAVSALLVCAVGFSPTPAFAADSDSVYVDGVELTGSSTTPAYATTDTSGAVTAGGSEDAYNIKWDGTTLTLNNATIDYQENAGDNTKGAIMFDGDLAIELKGDNRITSVTSGISCNGAGELTIRGDQLTIESAYYGIEGVDDTGRAITVSGAKLTIEVDTMPRFTAAGIQAAGLLSIADGAVLDITGATDEAAALIGNGGISIVGSTVSARIAAAGAYGMGVILSNGDVVIDGSMVEVSTSETVLNYALVSMANPPYTGGDIVIKNGSAVQANSTSGMAFHTSSGDIEIADSTVEATGGYMAVYAMGNLTIRGTADVTAQGPGPALFATGDCVLDPEEQLVDDLDGRERG